MDRAPIWRTVETFATYEEAESEIPPENKEAFRVIDTDSKAFFGVALKEALAERRMTPQALSVAADLEKSSIAKYLSGMATPRHQTIARIAQALNLPISYFVEELNDRG